MDDLSGLDWSSSTTNKTSKPPTNPAGGNYFTTLRPSPSPFASGRNTPLSSQASGNVAAKPQVPAKASPPQDSFSNLLSFGPSAKSTATLSLKEQQERLEAEKRRKEEEKRLQAASQFGNGQFLDNLGSRATSRTASPALFPPLGVAPATQNGKSDDDNLFDAFKAETVVDNASFYPPPPQKSASPAPPPPGLDLSQAKTWNLAAGSGGGALAADDDDPFGLNTLKSRIPEATHDGEEEDDDLLGDLGRPVEEVRRKQQASRPKPEPGKPIEDSNSDSDSDDEPAPPQARGNDPLEKAVAQLVDYGFTQEDARRGLRESGAGVNVQAAANWLLDDAHRRAKEKAKGKSETPGEDRGREQARQRDRSSWRDEAPQRRDDRSPAADGDFAQSAAALGSKAFKTAGSLWKMGQKKVQQAVADFQQPEGDSSVPKWMRATQQDRMLSSEKIDRSATDEAMMLESGLRPGKSHRSHDSRPVQKAASRDQSPALSANSSGRNSPMPRWQQSAAAAGLDSRSRLSKLAMEDDDDASTYISPNRRKRTPQPQAQTPPPPKAEEDLLFNTASSTPSQPPAQQPSQPVASQPVKRPSPSPRPTPKSAVPTRQVPHIAPEALQTSNRHRLEGTAHYKRGDFGAAHTSYTLSLSAVPPSHPLTIILLTNRALTALKTGAPKEAVDDADTALRVIGPSLGQGETVAVAGTTGAEERRDMRDLYGKALTRKAEALEQMERWADAAAVWQLCVEAGVGGAPAVTGRQRCQSALAPKPKSQPKPAARQAPARPRPSALAQLGGASQKSSEAVERLREANRAAAREDDEKFALSERVDARVAAWLDGRRENLRALLGSLELVLWEGSGWKKVGLHELVLANKVKVVYMKAIAKTHPDKLPQDASTEVRLIAATVFATLNESWDKFKAENGL